MGYFVLAKRINSRVMKPKSIMVWAGITSTGKTDLTFIPPGTRINAKYYQDEIIKKVVIPFNPRIFQQDGAPAHSAKSTISLLKKNFSKVWCKDIWPPYSPDLNPMDYSVWGILSAAIQGKRFAILEGLKVALCRAWDQIMTEKVFHIVNSFKKRLQACVDAGGGNFEHLLK